MTETNCFFPYYNPWRFALATEISAGGLSPPLDPICRGEEGLRVEILLHDYVTNAARAPFRAAKPLGIWPTCHCWIVRIKPSGRLDGYPNPTQAYSICLWKRVLYLLHTHFTQCRRTWKPHIFSELGNVHFECGKGALLMFVDVELREFMPRFLVPNKPAT